MSRRVRFALVGALAGAALLAGACVQYNEDCAPLVDNPDDVVGNVAGDVTITREVVRSGDNAIGEMVADAYRHSADDATVAQGKPAADVGIENSGSIRSDGAVCGSNDVVPRGPVRKKLLRQVLAFDDTISLIDVDVPRLKSVMEHSVAGFAVGTAAGTPAGSFLQISGITVVADCNGAAQTASAEGARVLRIVKEDAFASDGGAGGTVLFDADAGISARGTVRLACNSYVLTGGDGYVMLSGLAPAAVSRVDEQGLNFQIVAQYFQKTYPDAAHALSATPKPRWLLRNCAGALAP